jgi:transcriptional regulator with XRE-family HTH domain
MEISGFGVRLRKFRMARNLSLQKLADAVGASKAHIYELETGRSSNPSLTLLTSLSRELDVPIKDLIGESAQVVEGETPELVPLFRELRGLEVDDLEIIRALTQKLREKKNADKSGS